MGIGSVIKKYGYHNNCIIDNLPSAAVGLNPSTGEKQKHYAGGFSIGFCEFRYSHTLHLQNHVNIILTTIKTVSEVEKYRVVGLLSNP
jgi:transmembrane 9 superfamily member 2/4